ncbi:unnamed protein product [Penicillium salamii]|uniref:Uncharacterized protein n=1 Tax=Penicillium salamii TaxID=1612424 RepID=A0A9W4K105_9EURO|nr:unnamed protein product [Penicillium salamii]CAG8199533.1 unnamed protein product [Penicillium salamii]CAG8314368.1 unnamed protein product [Penicillium salamii]CAG8383507.1 unnamed protein product [Penicillium salamii]CAG8402824.1 unnamed protein product [Penicillium salamii]
MTSASLKGSLEIDPNRVGRPRFDPYQRLLGRFYEQLFLLHALGQTRGSHTPLSFDVDVRQAKSRRFLQNLCYICDFRKGGSTCTAIGLEELDTYYNFCVASNRETDKIVAFLHTALDTLRAITHPVGTGHVYSESQFATRCIKFASERVDEEKRCLRRYAKDCLSKLSGHIAASGKLTISLFSRINRSNSLDLVAWLNTAMNFDDNFALCNFAHDNRHSSLVKELERRGVKEETGLNPTSKRSCFIMMRHYIGRLAHHIRASSELIQDTEELRHVLDNYAVCPIYAPPAVPTPICDSHVNLRGILNRMFKKNSEDKDSLKEGLLHLHKVAGIFDTFIRQYNGSTLEVHAELQVLEYFWKLRKTFAGEDRFIACSKPACFCCELYFKYHPARVMVSSSHRKIWTKWSPPNVEQLDRKCPTAMQQRNIVNKMTETLREQVFSHVIQCVPSKRWHPDSITNITDTRGPSFGSYSLEISDETPGTLPSIVLGFQRNRRAIFTNTEVSGNIDTAPDFDGISDPENGGVSLSGYT